MSPEPHPLTRLICDLMRYGKARVRENWKLGHYPGVKDEHAAYYAAEVDQVRR
jgi:hypothetical protein